MTNTKTRCPKCEELGHDRSGDNLAIYPDGHSYCFKCHYYGHPPQSISALNRKISSKPLKSFSDTSLLQEPNWDAITYKIPSEPLKWLYKYGITNEEIQQHGLWYDNEKNLLVFPIYDGEQLVSTNSRYFGSNPKYPKYVFRGSKTGYFKLFPTPSTDIFILVEDFISAILVSRSYNCIPLCGTTINDRLILSLIYQKPRLRIWLDRDAAIKSINQAQFARQYIADCASIITEKDPKEYSNLEIKDIVDNSITQTISK